MNTVLITGCARGLGNALAMEFASRGYRVIGTTRSEEDAKRLSGVFGAPHRVAAIDSTDPDGLRRLAEKAKDGGGVDLVIANAGVINPRAPAWEIPLEMWDQHIAVNVSGMVATMQAFLPLLQRSKNGTFIGMSSGWGRTPSLGLGPYCASKFAVEGFIGVLVEDLANENSKVNAIALDPGGGVNTDMLAECLPEEHEQYRDASAWAPGAVNYILNDLVAQRATGSHEVPESAHS